MQRKLKITTKISPARTVAPAKSGVAATPAPAPAPEARSEYLLDVAAELFLAKGFEATSVGEIARHARASKETFYTRFNNKNDLFRAVINRLTERFGGDVGLVLAAHDGPQRALTAVGALLLERLLSDEGVGLQNIVYMESRRFPEIATIFYELGPSRTLAALAAYFDAQVQKGVLRKLDSKVAAAHFIGLLTSNFMMLRSLNLLGKPTAAEQTKRCREAVEVFLRAYGSSA